jgi:hypothetical protein
MKYPAGAECHSGRFGDLATVESSVGTRQNAPQRRDRLSGRLRGRLGVERRLCGERGEIWRTVLQTATLGSKRSPFYRAQIDVVPPVVNRKAGRCRPSQLDGARIGRASA